MNLSVYLLLSCFMFISGVFIVFYRKNMIAVLLGIELMLNSAGLNFVVFSRKMSDMNGQIFALFIIVIAACEAAVGLALIIRFFQNSESVHIDKIDQLRN